MMKFKKSDLQVGIEKFLKGKKLIFDVGTGPNGSDWWKKIDKGAQIEGLDLFFFPKRVPRNVKIYKMDADELGQANKPFFVKRYKPKFGIQKISFKKEKVDWREKFDMVVANHVLEHIKSPDKVVAGMNAILKKGGLVYAGFPDNNNFSDIFYHLVHPDSGGHIQQLTKNMVIKLFRKHGFKLKSCKVWPEDWLWLEKLYNWKTYMWDENKFLNQKQVNYLAQTFRKELTPKKGYFYGWEMVFEKK